VYSLTYTLAVGAAGFYVGIAMDGTTTYYIDNAMLVVGSVAADYAPLHPADDLARCLRYYEKLADDNDGSLSVSGIATAGAQGGNGYAAFKAVKPVAPTMTILGTWNNINCTAPTIGNNGTRGVRIATSSSAAGGFLSYNSGAGTNISAEANP
jgi:hypothetical protein